MPEKTSKTETSSSSATSKPLDQQFSYLQDAWNKANGIYNATDQNQYGGPVLASYTPEQLGNFQSMLDFAKNSGAPAYSNNVAAGAAGTAQTLGQTGQAQQATASGLYNMGSDIAKGGVDTTGAGVNTALTSANKLQNFTPTGGVDDNIKSAGLYADNPYINGQVDAAMRDSRRAVSEQALPQIARTSSLTGNIGSSKRGISEGIVERGLADKTADVSSTLRGDAYTKGLALSEQGREANNSNIIASLMGGGGLGTAVGSIGNAQTNVGFSGVNSGANLANVGTNAINAGTAAGALGLNANNQGLSQQAGLYDIANAGGTGQQASNQNLLDAQRQLQEYAANGDWNNVAKLYAIIGSNNWGSQTTSNGTTQSDSTKTASPLSMVAGGLGAATSLFGTGGLNMLAPAGAALSKGLFA